MDNRTLDKEIAEKFLGWTLVNGWWSDAEGKSAYWSEYSFNPTGGPTACSVVLDEIERRGWYWEWSHKWGSCFMAIYDLNGSTDRPLRVHGKAWHDNRYRALCEAVLQAGETERE